MRTFLWIAAVLAACGGDDHGDHDHDVDAPPAIDAPGCDVTAALPASYRPIAMVSTGAVTVAAGGGVTSGTVDGTAGGLAGAADNPYIYVDLINGARVDIDDVQSRSSAAWHVAFKRASIKLNGGDSGPGGVSGAAVAAATLAEVTAVPDDLAVDDWATDDCMLDTTPNGEPLTVFGEWYDYDPSTHRLTPRAEVWVLKLGRGDGAPVRKLRLTTYYGDPAMPMRGGYFGAEWSAMP